MEISPIKTITITDDYIGSTSPRYRAVCRGCAIGWYDTLAEAEAALLAAAQEEDRNDREWLRSMK